MLKCNSVLVRPLAFSNQKRIKISGFTFVQQSKSYPETYNVFDSNGSQVGYVCLRWGCLSCKYPNSRGERIYESFFESEYVGEFDNEEQRHIFLGNVANELNKRMNRVCYVELQQVECHKCYDKYGITFAHKGDKWSIIGKTEDSTWILKGKDGAIQMVTDKKFQEHFCVQIVVDEKAIVICA